MYSALLSAGFRGDDPAKILSIPGNLGQFSKYVVTMDELDRSQDGIKHRNIRDFLLAEEWN